MRRTRAGVNNERRSGAFQSACPNRYNPACHTPGMLRPPDNVREELLRRGVILEGATVGWNVVEGVIAVSAGAIASSVALIGFGVDSFVETASGAVVGWRLRAELKGHADEERIEDLEWRAGRIAGTLLLGLAVYVVILVAFASILLRRYRWVER